MVWCDYNFAQFIIRPHLTTMQMRQAYCYRQSSMVCLSVGLSQALQKTAEQIEMLLKWNMNSGGIRNHVLDRVQIPPCKGEILTGITLSVRQMDGWSSKINNSSTMESKPWRNAGPSAFQFQETMLKSDKIRCRYLVINCVSIWTFWMPLVSWEN